MAYIVGTTGNELITGSDISDIIDGIDGDDVIDGGLGYDSVVFFSASTNFAIRSITTQNTTSGADEVVTHITGITAGNSEYYQIDKVLLNIEALNFTDTTVVIGANITSPSKIIVTPAIQKEYISGDIGGAITDDIFDPHGGADIIQSGGGTDTVLLFDDSSMFTGAVVNGVVRITGLNANYPFYWNGIAGGDNVLLLTGIEQVKFSDGTTQVFNRAPTGNLGYEGVTGTPDTMVLLQKNSINATNPISVISDAEGIPSSSTFTYQWYADATPINGATSSSYTLTDNEVGSKISYLISYVDGHGWTEYMKSSDTPAVLNVNDLPTGIVSLTGTATENVTLAASNTLADIDGMGVVTYNWQRSTDNGITWEFVNFGSTYALVDADVGAVVRVMAWYHDARATYEEVPSTPTEIISNINDDPTGAVSVTGSLIVGQTLTAGSGTLADEDGLGEIIYTWQLSTDSGTNWSTAKTSSDSYELGDLDSGSMIRVVASYTDLHGATEVSTYTVPGTVVADSSSEDSIPVVHYSTTNNETITGLAATDRVSYADLYRSVRVDLSLGKATGGGGTDLLININNVIGSKASDYITGNSADNIIYGAEANDNINGGTGSNTIYGGEGNDTIYVGKFNNTSTTGNELYGGEGNDKITGGLGNDTLDGGAGIDILYGNKGDDTYTITELNAKGTDAADSIHEYANNGTDTVNSSINYKLPNNVENLTLAVSSGNTSATGNNLANIIIGNDGDNTIDGGTASDYLTGGAGADVFIFSSKIGGSQAKPTNNDFIEDFVPGVDRIGLSVNIFKADASALSAGTFNISDYFVSGENLTSALSINNHYIYNTTNGNLYYDPDGTGVKGSILFSELKNNPTLTSNDIYLF